MNNSTKLLTPLVLAVATVLHPMEPESNQFESKTKKQKIEEVILVGDNGSGEEFTLPISAAKQAELFKNLIEDTGQKQKIPLDVESKLLATFVAVLKRLDSYQRPSTSENNAVSLLAPEDKSNIRLLEIFSKYHVDALVQQSVAQISAELNSEKDLDKVATVLNNISIYVKDLEPSIKLELEKHNSLYHRLFLTSLKNPDPRHRVPKTDPLFKDVSFLKINPALKQMLIISRNNSILLYDFNAPDNPITKKRLIIEPAKTANDRQITALAFSDNGNYALVCITMETEDPYAEDKSQALLLDMTGKKISLLQHFNLNNGWLDSAKFSRDSNTLMLADHDFFYSINLSDEEIPDEKNPLSIDLDYFDRYQLEYETDGETLDRIWSFAVSDDKKYLLIGTGSKKNTSFMLIIDRAFGVHKILKTDGVPIDYIDLADNAQIALTNTYQGNACVWDLTKPGNSPASVLTQEGAEDIARAVALDHKGKLALMHCEKGKLILFDLDQPDKPVIRFSIQLPENIYVFALAFDNQNRPVIVFSENSHPRWCSFGDFMKALSLPQLVLLRKLEQFKADNQLDTIEKCAYFKDLYDKLSPNVKQATAEHLNL